MDPPLWTTPLHDNDDVSALDIDLAAQNYSDDYRWTDAYGQEANMFTPMSDPQFQYSVDQADMGVAYGNPPGMTPDHDPCCIVACADRSRSPPTNRNRGRTALR